MLSFHLLSLAVKLLARVQKVQLQTYFYLSSHCNCFLSVYILHYSQERARCPFHNKIEFSCGVGILSAGKMPVPQRVSVLVGWASCPPKKCKYKPVSI